ncbi:aminopeptidase N [Hwanghaeella sp.]|uniref:aminopeptidase N n=1 Tax=Hwanghaeella sp. TaxID=2605943 RepID=UPI003CCBFE14
MKTDLPQTIRLADYEPPVFSVDTVDLTFDLEPDRTIVSSVLRLRRTGGASGDPLVLDGENLELLDLSIDGTAVPPAGYQVTEESLTVFDAPDDFTLAVRAAINPKANTRLEGLYVSNTMFCTQCEAEGFRRITYFPDRPDVMAKYRVTLRGDKTACPVMLSNGNNISTSDLGDGRHESVWEDPFPKPSYLFALVAGDLAMVEDHFRTMSGRDVTLRIFVEHGNEDRCGYAMDSLIRSMRWDEERFGLEYDLDIFNIVAVSDFNMGAMENKSLNVFNAKYILADAGTATDADFANIESIVAHEYFHNWTGNRVTCRDWFQLSLKEGLTVFRDQEFSSDQRSRPVKRIQDVRALRARQFPEDSGPLSHPVRPDSYIEINNFYTATVYEKGAEVIGMMQTLLGQDGFNAGLRLYFERHDGQAVTCDDFVAAMADANDKDLSLFKRWYSQSGTPEVTVSTDYDGINRTYTLTLEQTTRPTPGQAEKHPLHIPLRIGLLGANGGDLALVSESPALDDGGLIHLTERRQTVTFKDIGDRPVLSANRGFGAPVILNTDQTDEDLAFLMAHDSDPFARWEAGQQYGTRLMKAAVAAMTGGAQSDGTGQDAFVGAVRNILRDNDLDPAFKALAITLPTEEFVGEQLPVVHVDEIHAVRSELRRKIGSDLKAELQEVMAANEVREAFSPTAEQAGRRALRNVALAYLTADYGPAAARLAKDCLDRADNMTDTVAALSILIETDGPERTAALEAFEAKWKDNAQVMDKWFALQAMSSRSDTLSRVKALTKHPCFDIRNPNKVRSLVGAFAMANPVCFHAKDGSGYTFLADSVIELDSLNPQVAARMVGALGSWRRYDADRQALMRAALERIVAVPVLSKDSFEIASKSL